MSKKMILIGSILIVFVVIFTITRNSYSLKEDDDNIEELKISLSSISEVEEVETAKSLSSPVIIDNSIENIDFSFHNPGDYIRFTFSIDNISNIDGRIDKITTKGINCTGDYSKEELESICKNISIDLFYNNSNKEIKEGDILFANSITPINAAIIYNNGPNVKEDIDVNIDDMKIELTIVENK